VKYWGEAALGIEGGELLAKAVLVQYQILGRQDAVLEADLMQILAAHRVVVAGNRKTGGALLDHDAADACAGRLAVRRIQLDGLQRPPTIAPGPNKH
jgi:hypothetical protein